MGADKYKDYVSKDQFGFYDISAEGAKKMVDNEDTFVLDVRDQASFDASHLENAHRMDVLDIENKKAEIPQDKNILVYCEVGIMSMAASKKLLDFGFKEVYNIEGGFEEWKKAGNPTEK